MVTGSICTSIGPGDIVTVAADDLKAALEQSAAAENSTANFIAAEVLRRHQATDTDDRPDDIDIDITERDRGWDQIFQDVVKRSSSLDEITVTTSFTCTKLRPDGFGGSVMLITADAIRYGSTTDLLEQFWNEAAKAKNGMASADTVI